ncbi:CbrC family protein [Flavobacterium sp. J27]|uniref:CbrC family protein n=1 Tax=Flavobacterium sp. J27 TaxID=2060419 RepID=UPI00103051C5|nr:CbrC family protein [Flavobacterium sp. J27]
MENINLKYFKSSLYESVFEYYSNGETCHFCKRTSEPLVKVDETIEIVTKQKEEGLEYVCLGCLLDRKYAFVQEVEGGYLTEEGIVTSSTKYKSLQDSIDYHTNLLPKEENLLAIEKSKIDELMHTPPFRAWQGAVWLTHCNDFMTFVDIWEHEDFVAKSPDGNAEKFFDEILDNWQEDDFYKEQFSPEKSDYAESVFYAFECSHCKKYRGYVD